MRARLAVGVALLSGCFELNLGNEPFMCGPGPEPCPPGYTCDVGRNVCVRNLIDGGTGPCQPGTTRCDGDTLVVCSSQGVPDETHCPVGCGSRGGNPVCLTLVPTDLPPDLCTTSTSVSLRVSGNEFYDTDQCAGGVHLNDPPRCLVTVVDVEIDEGATLIVTGSRIPVLVAVRRARIRGTIDLGAHGILPGPGYGVSKGGAGDGQTADATTSKGGGGAGHATKGGEAGANPGDAYGSSALSPILPGASGGGGGLGCNDICPLAIIAQRGGAGGAGHLVACEELDLDSGAAILAGGGGGPAGHGGAFQEPPGGGGGGGSGGAILIEAPEIVVGAGVAIAANGGGGGGGGARGADFTGPPGNPGDDGGGSSSPAQGGAGGDNTGGKGGNGGTADGHGSGILPGRGVEASSGGGGGGAAGRIRLNARPDRPPSLSGVVSPQPSTGSIGRD